MTEAAILNDGVRCQPHPDCAACGAAGRALHTDIRDVLFGAPGAWNIRRCPGESCGLAWLDPMPHKDDIGRFYQTYYTHHAADTPAVAPPARRVVRQFIKRALGVVFPGRRIQLAPGLLHFETMRPGRMLEVGCGSGQFLAEAAAAGWQVLGIDFDASAVELAQRIPGVDVRVMDIFDPSLDDERFDGIAMNNVIEHLADPARVFARCHELLAPGGRLVMVTPNVDAQCHEVFGRNWRGLEVPRHLYLYSAQALRRFAETAGFGNLRIFSPFHGWQIVFMADWSAEVARRSNQQPPVANRRRLKLRNAILAFLGRPVGEWITLVAHRERA